MSNDGQNKRRIGNFNVLMIMSSVHPHKGYLEINISDVLVPDAQNSGQKIMDFILQSGHPCVSTQNNTQSELLLKTKDVTLVTFNVTLVT